MQKSAFARGKRSYKKTGNGKAVKANAKVRAGQLSHKELGRNTSRGIKSGLQQSGQSEKKLYLKVYNLDDAIFRQLKGILLTSPGNTPVVLYVESQKKKLTTASNLWVEVDSELLESVKRFLGEDAVILQ
jgi:hypothetical protein